VLSKEGKGVALQDNAAVRLLDLELVVRAFRHAWQKNLPHATAEQPPHDVPAAIPGIEFADTLTRCAFGAQT